MTRGRDAHTPMEMPTKGWLDVLSRVWERLGTLHIALIAAGVAFYGLLSLFPAITAGVALVGYVFDASNLIEQSQWLLGMLPESAGSLIERQLAEVAGAESGTLGLAAILSLAIALWSSGNAMGSMVQGLNLIYDEEDTRGFIKTRLLITGLTLAMIFGLALAVAIVAAIPAALTLMGVGQGIIDTALVLRWPLMFVLGIFGIAALYRFGPCRRRAKWRWLTPGAVLGCTLWVIGTIGFSMYVQSFGSYNETFGALAGVIVLLTWLWLSSFVILLGGLLDAEMEAQTGKDSTVGPARPMGQRGAAKADSLGRARGEAQGSAEQSGLGAR